MASLPFDTIVRAPGHVLVRELEGESVLLNLDSEAYFGLDEVGTRMWAVLTTSPTIQAAYDELLKLIQKALNEPVVGLAGKPKS